MTKKTWMDVWVCQDSDGTVTIWDGTRARPKYWGHIDGSSWDASPNRRASMIFCEDNSGAPHKCRSKGYFSRKWGKEFLPGPGKCVGLLLET